MSCSSMSPLQQLEVERSRRESRPAAEASGEDEASAAAA